MFVSALAWFRTYTGPRACWGQAMLHHAGHDFHMVVYRRRIAHAHAARQSHAADREETRHDLVAQACNHGLKGWSHLVDI
jgi:hypothetical protein